MSAHNLSPGSAHRVLITDYKNSQIAAEFPFLFKKAGCIVDVFCSKDSWFLKNRYWDNHIDFGSVSEAEYVRRLEALARTGQYHWIVVCDDYTLDIVNTYLSDQELASVLLPLSKPESRMMLSSKAGFHTLCKKYGILSPVGALYEPGMELSAVFAQVPLPMLLKVDKSGGGKGITFCGSEADVQGRLSTLTEEEKKNLLFQEYIHGDIIAVEALFREGKLLAFAPSVVLKNTHDEFSVSFIRRYEKRPELEKILEDAGSRLGIHGFSSITFLFDAGTKKYYLVEADLRPQVWFPLTQFAGVDFSRAISLFLSDGTDVIRPSFPNDRDFVIRYFLRNVLYAIEHRDTMEILRWISNVEDRWKFIPMYDRRLLLATVGHIAKLQAIYIYTSRYCGFLRIIWRKVKHRMPRPMAETAPYPRGV